MPVITSIYAALTVLLFLGLSWRVIAVRRADSISLGDGGNLLLQRRIRAQANCAEYAPFGLILLLLIELMSGPAWVVHLLGLMLIIGRTLHAVALSSPQPVSPYRVYGMLLTLLMLAASAIAVLAMALLSGGGPTG